MQAGRQEERADLSFFALSVFLERLGPDLPVRPVGEDALQAVALSKAPGSYKLGQGSSVRLCRHTLATDLLGHWPPLLPPRSAFAELCYGVCFVHLLTCPDTPFLTRPTHQPCLSIAELGSSHHIQTVPPPLNHSFAFSSQLGQVHCPSEPQWPSLPRNLPKHWDPAATGANTRGSVFTPLGASRSYMIETGKVSSRTK